MSIDSLKMVLGGYAEEGVFGRVGRRFPRSTGSAMPLSSAFIAVMGPAGVFCVDATSFNGPSCWPRARAVGALPSRTSEFRSEEGSRDLERCLRCCSKDGISIGSVVCSAPTIGRLSMRSWSTGGRGLCIGLDATGEISLEEPAELAKFC